MVEEEEEDEGFIIVGRISNFSSYLIFYCNKVVNPEGYLMYLIFYCNKVVNPD